MPEDEQPVVREIGNRTYLVADVEPLDLRPGDEVWLTWNSGHAFGVPVDDQ